MNNAIDLTPIYNLRSNFVIIGITGRTGSGCSEVASLLNKGFDESSFPEPSGFPPDNNSFRKYRIIHRFAKENFKPFYLIEYKDVLTLFILKHGLKDLEFFLTSTVLFREFDKSKIEIDDFYKEIPKLGQLQGKFEQFYKELGLIDFNLDSQTNRTALFNIFDSEEFKRFSTQFHAILSARSKVKRNKTLGIISNNLRQSGHPYDIDVTSPDSIFTIAKVINSLAKAIRSKNLKTQVVIDSLRNPLEIMFFRQRFASFYLLDITEMLTPVMGILTPLRVLAQRS